MAGGEVAEDEAEMESSDKPMGSHAKGAKATEGIAGAAPGAVPRAVPGAMPEVAAVATVATVAPGPDRSDRFRCNSFSPWAYLQRSPFLQLRFRMKS